MESEDKFRASVSKLKAYTRCGRQFELERINELPSRPAAWTVRGHAVHQTIETWEAFDREGDPLKMFRDAWDTALAEQTERFPDLSRWMRTPRVKSTEQDVKLRYLDGEKQVTRYVERALDEADLWRVVETEVPFEIETEKFVVRGKIDQIREWEDGELSIWDIKTGSDDQEDNRQLGFYGLGYWYETGKKIPWGSYWYTKLDRASKSIDLNVYTQKYLFSQIDMLMAGINARVFLANPSKKNCFACGVAAHCIESKQ